MQRLLGIRSCDSTTPKRDLPLPRRVLKYFVTVAKLGLRSRVRIGGGQADQVCNLLLRLGIDSSIAESGHDEDRYDAALWIEPDSAAGNERSLLSPSRLQLSNALLQAVRPGGVFVFVGRLEDHSSGHDAACIERHLFALEQSPRLSVIPVRSLLRFFGRNSGSAYVLAACELINSAKKHRPASLPGEFSNEVCCPWAAPCSTRSRAA